MTKTLFLFFLATLCCAAQDSLANPITANAVPADSVNSDSVTVVEATFSPTSYFSEYSLSKQNELGEQITIYRGKAKLIYEDMKIEAYQIIMNFSTNELVATPKIDTLENGDLKVEGMPVFTQSGNEPMYGERMIYNFKKKRGRVFEGKTKVQTAKYEGEYIRKFGEKTMLIKDGKFTTCLVDSPSYWIHANKIRMIHGEKIFTGPLYMTIYDIPFPIPLPFGVFSMKKGRQSGVLIPSFYSGTTRGRGLQDFGYYWAASNQFEAKVLTDYYENTGYAYDLRTYFRDRYNYDGYFSSHYEPKDQQTGESSPKFGFAFGYRHTVDPSLSINGSGRFESSKTNTSNYRNFGDQTNQLIESNLSLSKRWGTSSLTANMNHSKNLITEKESYTLPNLNFQMASFALFGEADDPLNKNWYEKINMSYNSRLLNDWSNTVSQDTLGVYKQTDERNRFGIEHSIGLSAPYKIFKYITLSPYINATETWVTKVQEIDQSSTDTLIVKEKSKFAALHTFSTGISASTNIYGLMEPNIGSLKVLRHRLSPTASLNYRPDFSQSAFGYTEDVTQTKYDSRYVRTRKDGSKFVDRFALSPYSSTPTNESLSASFGLGQTFSGKFIDENAVEEKIDLLDLRSSASIDFLKDSLQWSDLSTSFSFPFIKAVSFSGNMIHSLYKLNPTGLRQNEFVDLIPILKSLSFSLSYNLKHSDLFSEADAEAKKVNQDARETLDDEQTQQQRLQAFKNQTLPWNVSLSSSYNYNRYSSFEKKQWTASVNTSLDLTPKWHVTHSTSIDLTNWQLQYQNYSITRDIECWSFGFTYSPNPYNNYYLLTIQIKDEMLEALEYKRHSRNLPVY